MNGKLEITHEIPYETPQEDYFLSPKLKKGIKKFAY